MRGAAPFSANFRRLINNATEPRIVHVDVFRQDELHQDAVRACALGHRRRHVQLGRDRRLGHRGGHGKLAFALVLAKDIAGQDREGAVARVIGRRGHHHLGDGVGRVLANLG